MRAQDFVEQLAARLPDRAPDFTDAISIISLTSVANLATALTATPHGLVVGDAVNITGAVTPIPITVANRNGFVGTITTSADHDATAGVPEFIELSGATEPEFNGSFKVIQVKNRRIITFQMDDSGPAFATGPHLLENASNIFATYGGLREVLSTATDSTFTYAIDGPLFSPAEGTIVAETLPRISTAIDLDRAVASYTRQIAGNAWLFVVLGDGVANKSRFIDADSTDNIQRGQEFDQQIIQTVSLYVFLPTSAQLGARESRDRAEELLQPICQSILFAAFDSLLATGKNWPLQFTEHGYEFYNSAFYIHRYTFEQTMQMCLTDTVGYSPDVAFRDIDLFQKVRPGTEIEEIESHIDLDDEPIP